MIGRAAPGPRLSTGRIRVDAAKAIAKLRDYQLVDRRSWILEAIRAAVASGARRIVLRGDADDVWLGWDGEPWPDEVLPTLFDELVSPEPARESQHLRLLATAVNTALGLATTHVDVIAIAADGAAKRVRYTPGVLAVSATDADADADTPLRRLEIAAIDRPEHAPAPGMLVHLRRRLGFGVVANLWRGAPPELAITRAACRDSAVPIEVHGEVLGRDRHARDLIRVALGEGLDGFIAIVDPAGHHIVPSERAARLEIAEHGVALAAYPITFAPIDDTARELVPVRVLVDAPRMPTNASRSEVRREAYPIAAAEQRARALFPVLVEQLATELAAAPPDSPRYRQLRAAALHLLAAQIAGTTWAEEAITIAAPLDKLAALPLLRNAVGVPRTVRAGWTPGVAHVGAPYPTELGPWLGGVLMLAPDGDAAARLVNVAAIDAGQVRRTAKRARKALRARDKFLGHASREPVVRPRGTPRATLTLGPTMGGTCGAGRFAGITGQVCLVPGDGASELVLLHRGRELETVSLASPLRFQAVIACDAIAPQPSYRSAVRDDVFDGVVLAARAAAIRCAEAIALTRANQPAPGASVHGWVPGGEAGEAQTLRQALVACAHTRLVLGDSPLLAAAIWPTVDGRWLRLADLDDCDVIGVITPGAEVELPRDRTVIAVESSACIWLEDRIGVVAHVVRYTAPRRQSIDPAADLARVLAADHQGVALAIREPGVTAAIAPVRVGAGEVSFRHVGVALDRRPYKYVAIGCDIVVDDDSLVPTTEAVIGDDLEVADRRWLAADGPGCDRDFTAWERALLSSIARAVLGDPELDLVRPYAGPVSLDDPAGRVLLAAIVACKAPSELLGAELVARLRQRRIVDQLGFDTPRTIEELVTGPEPAIPYITTRPALPLPGWHPVIADPLRARAIERLAGHSLYDAEDVLAGRIRAAERTAKLDRHLLATPTALELPATTPQVAIAKLRAIRGVVGIGDLERMVVHVHLDGRRFATEQVDGDLPLIALIDIHDNLIDDDLAQLRPAMRVEILDEIRAMGPVLVEAVLDREPRTLVVHAGVARLLRRLLYGTRLGGLRARLAAAPMFALIQGGTSSVAATSTEHGVRIATWDQPWLGPDDPAAPHALDRPVIRVPDGDTDLRQIVHALAAGPVSDVTDAVTRLQTRRRVARGLVAVPTVAGAEGELTRALDRLGAVAERLGPGEIALVDADRSLVFPFAAGTPGAPIELDVLPPVRIAVEAPDLMTGTLTDEARAGRWGHVQRVATALVRNLTRPATAAALPEWARRRIRDALVARRLDAADVGEAPIVQTTTGDWLGWKAIADQRHQFGSVWVTDGTSNARPLDPARIAFRFGALRDGFLDATEELRLDEQTRTNQARPRAGVLAVSEAERAGGLGTAFEIKQTARRGWVVPLAPGAARLRGVRAHKDLFPFDPTDDPCPWPTATVIDDPTLTPDRTWSRPADNAAWAALRADVRAGSDKALRALGAPPDDAVVKRFVEPRPEVGGPAAVTGWLWLASPSHHPAWLDGPGAVRVAFADRQEVIVPSGGSPVRGWLAILAPFSGESVSRVDALIARTHGLLLIDASDMTTRDDAACHVATGLLGRAMPALTTTKARFHCFRPRALSASELVDVFADDDVVLAVLDGRPGPWTGDRAIVDDGSHLARLMIRRFGARAVRRAPEPEPWPPSLPGMPPSPVAAAPPPPPPPPRDEWIAPPHPLQGLADAIRARLDALGLADHVSSIAIIRHRTTPLIEYLDTRLELADHPQLHAIETARAAGSPFAPAAIDAVVAHAVTVLNVRLTAVTDGTEAGALARLLHTEVAAG